MATRALLEHRDRKHTHKISYMLKKNKSRITKPKYSSCACPIVILSRNYYLFRVHDGSDFQMSVVTITQRRISGNLYRLSLVWGAFTMLYYDPYTSPDTIHYYRKRVKEGADFGKVHQIAIDCFPVLWFVGACYSAGTWHIMVYVVILY